METIREKLNKQIESSKDTWGQGYNHFSRIINRYNLKVGAEIGVAYGGHSEAILQKTSVEKLYGIDPYKYTEGYVDSMNYEQEIFDELYKTTTDRLAKFSDRYIHIRKYSKDAISDISGQIDFVYIDADHSYRGVWNDLCLWFSKVKDGGIIGGHDYMHPDFPGVQQAISEFFDRLNWPIHYEGDNVWWVEKKYIPISFFIPAFNCANTVAESINSIIETNLADGDEIVVVDDFSTDDTPRILKEFAEKYSFIKILTHPRNRGGATARNTAIENCKNEILFCLDSDNILMPNSIAPLKKYFLEKGADVAAFQNIYFFKDDINILHKKVTMVSGLVTLKDCLDGQPTPPASGNYMFSKKSWLKAGGYPDGNWLDTWGFGIRQLFNGAKMYTLPDTYYYHRRGHESYYIRGAKSTVVSLIALQVLIPYFDRLSKKSVHYIMGSGRYDWFENLNKKHLKLRSDNIFSSINMRIIKEKIKSRFPNIYRKYLGIRK